MSDPKKLQGVNPANDDLFRANLANANLTSAKLHNAFLDTMPLIETDALSWAVLPGHPQQMFVMQENSDGSILLLPAKVTTEAQLEYDQTPELKDLLAKASASGTVCKRRRRVQ